MEKIKIYGLRLLKGFEKICDIERYVVKICKPIIDEYGVHIIDEFSIPKPTCLSFFDTDPNWVEDVPCSCAYLYLETPEVLVYVDNKYDGLKNYLLLWHKPFKVYVEYWHRSTPECLYSDDSPTPREYEFEAIPINEFEFKEYKFQEKLEYVQKRQIIWELESEDVFPCERPDAPPCGFLELI